MVRPRWRETDAPPPAELRVITLTFDTPAGGGTENWGTVAGRPVWAGRKQSDDKAEAAVHVVVRRREPRIDTSQRRGRLKNRLITPEMTSEKVKN
ncbi:hypothetical protein EYF80_051704 [Liparis tanakae]|uniref:Uncharacterized protein n=1 Tax=Liparis tanakae TaxID=230148 RepID=A0A4Z2FCM6_9TELE|nr:hypothetical protein EYF80_051704 [Liparis tanakae]